MHGAVLLQERCEVGFRNCGGTNHTFGAAPIIARLYSLPLLGFKVRFCRFAAALHPVVMSYYVAIVVARNDREARALGTLAVLEVFCYRRYLPLFYCLTILGC